VIQMVCEIQNWIPDLEIQIIFWKIVSGFVDETGKLRNVFVDVSIVGGSMDRQVWKSLRWRRLAIA
jgi:hypothetical protein